MKSVFISSTFKDMNFERDALNRRVAPKINHQLANYNQSVRLLDLRWGVDTSDMAEQDASERVLSTCFNAIDNCKPYIVVLLGDRYGYIPDNSNISVTHMEILRGVFESTEREHIFIYFRDCDYSNVPDDIKDRYIEQDEASVTRLAELKDELQKIFPDRCKRYKAKWSEEQQCLISDDFEKMVVEDLEFDIVRKNQGICYRSDLHKQLCENEEILAENVRFSYSNTNRINADIDIILGSAEPYGIIGDGGTGKSVYMSLLCSALRDKGHKAYILFCGDNAFSASIRNAAETVLFILTEALGTEYNYEDCASLSYDEIIARIIDKRVPVKEKQYLLLDAVDKCDKGMINFVYWCDSFLSEQIKIVFSSRMIAELNEHKETFTVTTMTHNREDFREMIRCILSQYKKSVSDEHIKCLLDKVKTPLQLNLLLRRLLNLRTADFDAIQKIGGGMDAINRYLKQVIDESPAKTAELIAAYMSELLKEISNPAFSIFLLAHLAYCEYGLLEEDIRALFELFNTKWVELDYVEFLEQFDFFIRIRDNGRLDISHDIIKQTICALYAKDKKTICSLLSMYLLHRDPDKSTVRAFFDVAFKGEQHKKFAEFILKYKDAFLSTEASSSILAADIRNGIQRIYFKDDGNFLFAAMNSCRSADDIGYYQMILSSSLYAINDYYEEDIILKIAHAAMIIPIYSGLFTDNLFELEMRTCERFLNRHNVRNARINDFKAFCIKEASEHNKNIKEKKDDTDESLDSMINELRSAEPIEKPLLWVKLSKNARAMAADEKTAHSAESLANELLTLLHGDEIADETSVKELLYADLYTTFGVAYKTLKEWEKALHFDKMSFDIYKKIYDNNPTQDVFRKYRERVYNLANVTEAWAMEEKNNMELWHRTKDCYKECYALELTAISQGISKRDILHSSSTILSLGTALINMGSQDEGIQKYKEGIALITDSAKNNRNPDLYTELSIHLLECVYRLLACGNYSVAYELSSDISSYLDFVIKTDLPELTNKLNDICRSFSNCLNDILRELHEHDDFDGQLTVSRILYNMYIALLPIAQYRMKVNIIITKSNICSLLLWKMQDYAQAYDEYQELLNLVVTEDLAAPDENGNFADEANGHLVDAYIRSLLCLEKLGRQDELKQLIDKASEWALFFAEHTDTFKGDVPLVLYRIACVFSQSEHPLGIVFIMMAFNAVNDEQYDKKAHPETIMQILKAVGSLKDGNNE